jgi:quercetin dioxygenase-like cupin family protein
MVLSSTKTGSQVLVEPGKTSFANGNIWFESFKDTPRIHRVWNEDTVEFHVIDMELLHTPSPDSQQLSLPFSKDLFKADPVRAYRVTLPPGQGFALEYNTHPFVVVGLSGSTATGTVNGKHFTKKGDFLFLPAGAPGLSMSNKGSRSVQFAVFELF